jgi:hypothetical protein
MSGAVLGSLEIQMYADLARLRQDMGDAKGMVSDAMRQISDFANMATQALGALGLAASVSGLVEMFKNAVDAAAGLQQLSEQTGVSVEALSALRSVARLSGTSMDDVRTGLQKLSKSMVDAEDGTGKAAMAFKALGVSVTGSNGQMKTADQVFLELAQSTNNFKEGAALTTAMIDLLGKAGANLGPVLRDLAERGDLVGKVTAEQAQLADDYEKRLIKLQGTVKGLATSLALELLPYIDNLSGLLRVGIEVGAAWIALVYGVPAALAAAGVAAEAFGAAIFSASLATTTLSTSLGVAVGMTQAAIVEFGLLKASLALLVAAFAGWEIGKWLSDNFVEARLAGVGFVEGMLVAWEEVKFAGQAMWLAVQDTYDKVIAEVGEGMATLLDHAANGLQLVGFSETAKAARDFAASIRETSGATVDFDAELAKLRQQTDDNIAGVRAITSDMADEATAHFASKDAAKAHKEELKLNADAASAASKEFANFTAKLQELIAQRAVDISTTEKVTDADKQAIAARQKFTGAQLDYELALIEVLRNEDAYIELRNRATKADEAAAVARLKEFDALEKNVDKLQDEIAAQQAINASMYTGADYTTALALAKLREAAASADRQAMIVMERQGDEALSEEFRKQAEALRGLADAKEAGIAAKAAQQAAAEWQKTTEAIGTGVSNALEQAFTAGGNFFKNFGDNMKAWFEKTVFTLAFAPVQQGIMNVVAGAMGAQQPAYSGGGAWGSASGMASLYNTGSSLYSGAAGYGSAAYAWLTGGTSAAATQAMMDEVYAGTAASGTAASGSAGAAGASGSSASAIGGYALLAYIASQMAQGDYAKGFNRTSAANSGTLLGDASSKTASLMTNLGLNAKWADIISGATLTARLFGMGSTDVREQGIDGSIGGGAVSAQSFQQLHRDGGLFRHDQDWTQYAGLDTATMQVLNDGAKNVLSAVKSYGVALGLPVDQLAHVTTAMRAVLTGDAAKDSAAVQDAFKAYQADLVATYQSALSPLQKTGESLADTMVRVSGTLRDVNTTFGTLGLRLFDSSISGAKAAASLVDLTGGMDAFINKTAAYVSNYYSEAEQGGIAAKSILQQLDGSGLSIGDFKSRADLRTMLESIDPNGANGSSQIAALLNVSSDYAKVADYLQKSGLTLAQLAAQAPTTPVTAKQDTPLNLDTTNSHLVTIVNSVVDVFHRIGDLLATTAAGDTAVVSAVQDLSTAVQATTRPAYLGGLQP